MAKRKTAKAAPVKMTKAEKTKADNSRTPYHERFEKITGYAPSGDYYNALRTYAENEGIDFPENVNSLDQLFSHFE